MEIRPATLHDAEGIATAHVDSIRTLGPQKYPPEIVAAWSARSVHERGTRIKEAMERGETFFVAEENGILGFSSYRFENGKHRVAIYICGGAARKGLGSQLIARAENEARKAGAKEIHVDASLVAEAFYARHGFEKIADGMHVLNSGQPMACVHMQKRL